MTGQASLRLGLTCIKYCKLFVSCFYLLWFISSHPRGHAASAMSLVSTAWPLALFSLSFSETESTAFPLSRNWSNDLAGVSTHVLPHS